MGSLTSAAKYCFLNLHKIPYFYFIMDLRIRAYMGKRTNSHTGADFRITNNRLANDSAVANRTIVDFTVWSDDAIRTNLSRTGNSCTRMDNRITANFRICIYVSMIGIDNSSSISHMIL